VAALEGAGVAPLDAVLDEPVDAAAGVVDAAAVLLLVLLAGSGAACAGDT